MVAAIVVEAQVQAQSASTSALRLPLCHHCGSALWPGVLASNVTPPRPRQQGLNGTHCMRAGE
jgi:hypothetical protein